MPNIELLILFAVIGVATGPMASTILISPALLAVPILSFFLPVLGLSFDAWFLVCIATAIVAFLPTHLYAWIVGMKNKTVETQVLIRHTAGMGMGGVIGAQLLSLASVWAFTLAFSLIALLAIVGVILDLLKKSKPILFHPYLGNMPSGLLIGTVSVVSGNGGGVLGHYFCHFKRLPVQLQQSTVEGFVVFISIAAMVGFLYPASAFDNMSLQGFAGVIYLPGAGALAISHFFFYWLCRNRGNELDKKVLSMSFVIFLLASLTRMWTT